MSAPKSEEDRRSVDRQNRLLEQEAGTDRDLGSMVPALPSRLTQGFLGVLLAALVLGLVWLMI